MRQTTRRIALFFCFAFCLAALSNLAQAQTFTVLHAFTGGADGAGPASGVTLGGPGILYGTTSSGGTGGNGHDGVAFKLTQRGSGWELEPLYEFNSEAGINPLGPLTFRNGALYGTTEYGGAGGGGTVFELQPPPTACKTSICYWNETVLHSFAGGPNDGENPYFTNLVFDQAGNLYGTTAYGGTGSGPFCNVRGGGNLGCGTAFQLSPSGGGWTFNIVHNFESNGIDGVQPWFGMIFDAAGNLYGTTTYGGISSEEAGVAFELTPSGGAWTETILYDFVSDYQGGSAGANYLVMDESGNLYGSYGTNEPQIVAGIFELTRSEGGWSFSTLATINACSVTGIARDTAGNFYGACSGGGQYDWGWVFELTNSGGSWTVTDLHDFTLGGDGGGPGPVVLDSSGNLYGTAGLGGILGDCGLDGCGTVWEITP